MNHPIESIVPRWLGKTCGNEPSDVVFAPSPYPGVTFVAWFYSQLWQWDLGSKGWYKVRDKGPYVGIMAAFGGGWPEAPDVVAKNPPWRYELIWYWSKTGWKRYAEAYSYIVGDLVPATYNALYC